MRFRLALAVCLAPSLAWAAPCTVPNTFINGTIIDAGQMNANIAALESCIGSNAANNASNINTGTLGAAFGGTGNVGGYQTGGLLFATSTTQISGTPPANLFWDSTNHRLGIGTASPVYPLDVNGTIHSLLSDVRVDNNHGFVTQNTAGTYNPALIVDASNNVHVGNGGFGGSIQFENNGGAHASLD